MKCDDDTFVRLESVMAEVKKIRNGESLYIGNMNYHHKPLRDGKWAVTYEVSLVFDSSMISHAFFLSFIDLDATHYISVYPSEQFSTVCLVRPRIKQVSYRNLFC